MVNSVRAQRGQLSTLCNDQNDDGVQRQLQRLLEKEVENAQEESNSRLSSAEQRIVAYGKYPFYRPENGQAWLPKQARHPVVG